MAETLITADLVIQAVRLLISTISTAKEFPRRLKSFGKRLQFLASQWETLQLDESQLRYINDLVQEATKFLLDEMAKKGVSRLRSAWTRTTTDKIFEFDKRLSEMREDIFKTVNLPKPTKQEASWGLIRDAELILKEEIPKVSPAEIPILKKEIEDAIAIEIPKVGGMGETLVDVSSVLPANMRAPIDLVIILDVSDSMGFMDTKMIEQCLGRKITDRDCESSGRRMVDGQELSAPLKASVWDEMKGKRPMTALRQCQNTIIGLLDKLSSTLGDRIGIVTFGDDARVFMDLQNIDKQTIINRVESLQRGGGTNIEAGLRTGFDHLKTSKIEGDRLLEVWFLTDGVPSAGERNALALKGILEQLMEEQAETSVRATLSAIGYGVGCDENILRMLGSEGGGQMHTIDDGASTKEIVQMLDLLLENAFSTVCKNIEAICTVEGGELVGDPITSFRYEIDSTSDCAVFISDIRRGEPKTFIIRYQPTRYPCYVTTDVWFTNSITGKREKRTLSESQAVILEC